MSAPIRVTCMKPLSELACNPPPLAGNPASTAAAGPEGCSCSAVHICSKVIQCRGMEITAQFRARCSNEYRTVWLSQSLCYVQVIFDRHFIREKN